MMQLKCEDCTQDATWLVVTRGREWIGRFCSAHVRKIDHTSEIYARTSS